jgi:hypothetical protein
MGWRQRGQVIVPATSIEAHATAYRTKATSRHESQRASHRRNDRCGFSQPALLDQPPEPATAPSDGLAKVQLNPRRVLAGRMPVIRRHPPLGVALGVKQPRQVLLGGRDGVALATRTFVTTLALAKHVAKLPRLEFSLAAKAFSHFSLSLSAESARRARGPVGATYSAVSEGWDGRLHPPCTLSAPP